MRKKEGGLSVEVSLVGAGFDRFSLPPGAKRVSPGFMWAVLKGSEDEILVKVRSVSRKPAKKALAEIRPAHPSEVKAFMLGFVRGYLRLAGHENVKLAGGTLDIEKGHLVIKYVADQKLDLRPFGPRLAKLLHVKVELVQIGARDHAREMGGIGKCGLEFCCSRWLGRVPSVSLEMARLQGLFVAPEKLSGVCGRLMCCLVYELEFYKEMAERMPPIGTVIKIDEREMEVVARHPILEKVVLRDQDGRELVVGLDELPWEGK